MSEEGDDGLAPVIPLFAPGNARGETPAGWDLTWREEPSGRLRGTDDADDSAQAAAAVLLRRLRTRQLSVREAEAVLRAQETEPDAVAAVIARCVDLGYLDDAGLAERLVEVAASRQGRGRQLIAQTLAQRGIPREIAEGALALLPDDEAERALEFARTRVRSVRGAAPDAALRRLVGQLARRGYASSTALAAARQALAE